MWPCCWCPGIRRMAGRRWGAPPQGPPFGPLCLCPGSPCPLTRQQSPQVAPRVRHPLSSAQLCATLCPPTHRLARTLCAVCHAAACPAARCQPMAPRAAQRSHLRRARGGRENEGGARGGAPQGGAAGQCGGAPGPTADAPSRRAWLARAAYGKGGAGGGCVRVGALHGAGWRASHRRCTVRTQLYDTHPFLVIHGGSWWFMVIRALPYQSAAALVSSKPINSTGYKQDLFNSYPFSFIVTQRLQT